MNVRYLMTVVCLSLGSLGVITAQAADPAAAIQTPPRPHGEMREEMKKHCAANPQECADIKARMKKEHEAVRAACEKEPERCREIRQAHREKMRETLCAENPERCAKIKARREAMQQQCAADPKACEAKKAEFRTWMKEQREQSRAQHLASPRDGTASEQK